MTIFLTGSTGFIGTNLLEKLKNEEVFCYQKGGDIIEEVREVNPDVIIHLAGEIYKTMEMYESNIKLTYDLLAGSLRIPYKSFVYIGSSSEYGAKIKPMAETDILNPRNMYEATKGCGTLLCQSFAREFDKPISIARPFSVYGKHEPEHRFIPTAIRALKEKQVLNIAPGVHDFIHIDDFIRGIMALVENPQKAEIFNFGTGIQYSNEEVVQKIECLAKKKIKKQIVGKMRPYDTDCWVADNRKAKELLGWKVTKTLSDGLSELI